SHKRMGLEGAGGRALWVARAVVVFARLTSPLIVLMNGTGNAILRLCGFRPAGGGELAHSLDELSLLIEDTEEAGILAPAQAEFVQKVFRSPSQPVRDSVGARDRMGALGVNSPPAAVA